MLCVLVDTHAHALIIPTLILTFTLSPTRIHAHACYPSHVPECTLTRYTRSNRILEAGRENFSKHVAAVVMNVFGLSHTRNTKVGNDFVRGVSGGERKRVSIAEMALAGSPIAAWDNSTRGLE
jgi:ABC-type multidrug transport system ATPase subunit